MSVAPGSLQPERELLAAAKNGDEGAFGRLVEPRRRELHAHCYRMLGSLHDAEDAFQEAMLRAWKGLGRLEDGASLRAWLYRIATNTCLDAIAKRPKRVVPIDYAPPADPQIGPGEPVVESVWLEPYPDELLGAADGFAEPEADYEQREAVELAFVAALQHLPSNQRAALILREVLGFSAAEVAEALDTTVVSVNSALQRARRTIDDKLPEQSQQETLRALGDEEVRETVENWMGAMQRGDIDAVVAMLADDAAWSMPPLASWYSGLEEIEIFLGVGPLSGDWRWKHVHTRANGQAAAGSYTWDEQERAYLPFALDVFSFDRDGRIRDITAFVVRTIDLPEGATFHRWPDHAANRNSAGTIFDRFGLPPRLEA